MISYGSRPCEFLVDPLPYMFVDYDNLINGLKVALLQIGISESRHSFFEIRPLIEHIAHSRRIYIYSSLPEGTEPDDNLSKLRAENKTIFKHSRLTEKKSGRKQEGLDVLLAIDAIQCAYKKTTQSCVLVSGDGDFLPLVDALVSEGVATAVASFGNPTKGKVAPRLRDACDHYIHIGYHIISSTYSHLLHGVPNTHWHFETANFDKPYIVNIHGTDFRILMSRNSSECVVQDVLESEFYYKFESLEFAMARLELAGTPDGAPSKKMPSGK